MGIANPSQQRRAATTRAALSERAHKLFTRYGWTGVSARQILGSRGISHIYDHFGSMTKLWEAVMGCSPPSPERAVQDALHANSPLEAREILITFLHQWRGTDK